MLHEVSIRIAPGAHLAVVGTTGSGKSTLASLLAGLLNPDGGTVFLDVKRLDEIATASARVVLVAQESHVFAGTIADNLRIGNPHATDHDIAAAFDAVGAHGWVATLPAGTSTPVGGGSHALTASQAQHLALARILLIDPDYVLLDEATAEAGSDTARLLDHAARTVLGTRGSLTVVHRLSQSANADLILAKRNGQVIEEGTHAELIARGGRYAQLWAAWAR